jgi:hypothetical protein
MKSLTSIIAAAACARAGAAAGAAAGAGAVAGTGRRALLFSEIVSILSWGTGTENFACRSSSCSGPAPRTSPSTSFQCCPTNLRGFYMSFMISGSRASIFHPCQLIDAILMCMEPSILIRFGSCCISAPACNMPVVEIIVIV